jgi:hypothetical protein
LLIKDGTHFNKISDQLYSSLIRVDKQAVIRFLPSVFNSRHDQLIGSGGLLDSILGKEMQDIGKLSFRGPNNS